MGTIDRPRDARRTPWRKSLWVTALLVGLASCGGGDGDDIASTGETSTTETTETTETTTVSTGSTGTSPPTTRPKTTTTSAAATTTTIRVLSTVLVGAVVGGNSGGIGEGDTLELSDTVRTSDSQCIGWTGKANTPKPWTAALQQGRTVRVLDDKGAQIGTGTLGAGRPKQVRPNDGADKHWQCEFEFSINVVQASAYYLEIEGVPRARAETNPQRAGAFVVPVMTPVDAGLISECADGLPDDVHGWDDVVDEYWAVAFRNLCNSGLRIGTVKRQCRPHDVATLYVMSVMARDGTVLQDRASGGPTVDPTTLSPGTKVDVSVTTAVPCH